jgi:hypothetical protein
MPEQDALRAEERVSALERRLSVRSFIRDESENDIDRPLLLIIRGLMHSTSMDRGFYPLFFID